MILSWQVSEKFITILKSFSNYNLIYEMLLYIIIKTVYYFIILFIYQDLYTKIGCEKYGVNWK